VELLSHTVDPMYDQPEILKSYAKTHGADFSIWTFVNADSAGVTKGEFRFAVRDVTTDTAPTVALTIQTSGVATFANTISATGATLTGALSGTSAGFSGDITIHSGIGTSLLTIGGTNGDYATAINLVGNNTFKNWQIGSNTGVQGSLEIRSSTVAGGTTFTTPVFSLSTTGAATFSSSVTASGVAYISGNSNTGPIPYLQLTDNYGSAGRNWAIMNGYENYGTFSIKVSSSIGGNPTTGTPVFNITQAGNVGIGTTAPGSALEIARASGTASYAAMTSGSTSLLVGVDAAALPRLFVGSATAMSFWTDSTERMRITSGGQVQIKQAGNTYSDGLRFINTSTNHWSIVHGGDGSLYMGYNSADRGVFNTSTGTYTALSDKNKKKDFEVSNIGLNEVMKLKPTLYRMKSDESEGQKELGFIAQDVKSVIPNAYVESGDFIGLNFNPIVAALTKAVQELKAELDTLKNK
jgi:hypothetical protein